MARERRTRESPNDQLKSERVYRELRRRIREMELLPGSRLRKDEIAVEAGTSRAPINEAIARLAAEGLIDVFPQSGSFVSLIRPEDVRESMLIRTGLEVEAVRRVTKIGDPELLRALEANIEAQTAAVREDNMVRLDDLDEAFHATILQGLHSPRAQRLLDATRAILDRPRFRTLPEPGRPMATVIEHSRIVDAIGSGDIELAAAAMRVHLTIVAQAIEADLARMDAEGNPTAGG
jgi:DNA-binding GntR family transcriptional regulator